MQIHIHFIHSNALRLKYTFKLYHNLTLINNSLIKRYKIKQYNKYLALVGIKKKPSDLQ